MIIGQWQELLPHLKDLLLLDKNCFPESNWPCFSWKKFFECQRLKLICSYQNKTMTGFLAFNETADEAELLRLGVKKEFRRKTVGQQLVKRMIDYVKSRAFKKIFLEVRQENLPALALYKSLNFVEIGLRKNYYTRPNTDAIVLRFTP